MASIRKATQEDAPSIARVQIETWRATYREIVPAAYLTGLNEEDRTIRWREHLNSSERVFVAERDGEVLASSTADQSVHRLTPMTRSYTRSICCRKLNEWESEPRF